MKVKSSRARHLILGTFACNNHRYCSKYSYNHRYCSVRLTQVENKLFCIRESEWGRTSKSQGRSLLFEIQTQHTQQVYSPSAGLQIQCMQCNIKI